MKDTSRLRAEMWIALGLCAAVFLAGLVQCLLPDHLAYARSLAPGWLPLMAAGVAAAGIALLLGGVTRRRHLRRTLSWAGVLLLLWTASGLPLDLLRVVNLVAPGLMPSGIDWPGLATRVLALAALVVLGHLALVQTPVRERPVASWYGYAALALALPYPVLKTWWALGGSFGLRWPGADGLAGSFDLWLPAVPWLLAAVLSLLLVLTPRWMPRRLLVAVGWAATVAVAMFGPVACLSLVSGLIQGDADFGGMAGWVYGVVYGSWFLWAVAAGAATHSYQLRSRRPRIAVAGAQELSI